MRNENHLLLQNYVIGTACIQSNLCIYHFSTFYHFEFDGALFYFLPLEPHHATYQS